MHTGIETKHPSWEGFMTWKEAEEESSFTYFVQPNGGKPKIVIVQVYNYVGRVL